MEVTFNCEQPGFLSFWGGAEVIAVTSLDKVRILDVMSKLESNDPQPREDQLENLLDEQSDEEFGLPEFSEHVNESNGPVVLKDWTAQDFASIYVRFRPHLERHAKRYLVNPSQVEEVVQDAFLYIMTTLPELDSEIGVLKFLKWKTRLLALDVIRANSRVSLAPLDSDREFEADLPESSQDLERADDAAIVSLALAKLQPRHREALIATLYEEKSAALVSAQMGMSENAFRQLLFRSRTAFKKALIGEAETAGLSMSAVLSIAARKAAAESGKYISAAGAFLLVLAVSIGVLPQITTQPTVVSAVSEAAPLNEQPLAADSSADPALDSPSDQPATSEAPQSESNATVDGSPDGSIPVGLTAEENEPVGQEPPQPTSGSTQTTEAATAGFGGALEQLSESAIYLQEALGPAALTQLAGDGAISAVAASGAKNQAVISSANGLTGYIDFDLGSERGITAASFKLTLAGDEFISVPKVTYSEKRIGANGSQVLDYVATDLAIGDVLGNYDFIASNDTEVSRGALRVTLVFDRLGSLTSSTMKFSPRS